MYKRQPIEATRERVRLGVEEAQLNLELGDGGYLSTATDALVVAMEQATRGFINFRTEMARVIGDIFSSLTNAISTQVAATSKGEGAFDITQNLQKSAASGSGALATGAVQAGLDTGINALLTRLLGADEVKAAKEADVENTPMGKAAKALVETSDMLDESAGALKEAAAALVGTTDVFKGAGGGQSFAQQQITGRTPPPSSRSPALLFSEANYDYQTPGGLPGLGSPFGTNFESASALNNLTGTPGAPSAPLPGLGGPLGGEDIVNLGLGGTGEEAGGGLLSSLTSLFSGGGESGGLLSGLLGGGGGCLLYTSPSPRD